jgi:hypothetical protein
MVLSQSGGRLSKGQTVPSVQFFHGVLALNGSQGQQGIGLLKIALPGSRLQ